ncbi:MAG: ABC transporter ATP-binding protein [Lachnospiraceae bacterium]|nr:ABC transporter ATP-binding protein [Lachnospiraceae bacterium]
MLEIQGLEKKLEGFTLQDVNIELPKGYIMGLIGENGAGKTTLLNLILGLYKPTKGQIIIDGMTYENQEKEIRNLLGYVLVDDVFSGEMKLIEQADMYGKYYDNYDRTLFLEYCKRFELEEKKKYKKLSKGEKLKFQFAFALAHKPKLLILDEPTANFDPEFREEFLKIITEFVANGENSVLLATHMTEELDRFADYITFLHKGNVKFSVERSELESKYRLVSGEDYKINLIKKERVIHKEKGKYATTALVEHTNHSFYSPELDINVPSVEDIMYHMIKSEQERGKRAW